MATLPDPSELQSFEAERVRIEAQVRQLLSRIEMTAPLGAVPDKPRFGSSGFLDPALEYFIRNELEKTETRLKAAIDGVRANGDSLRAHMDIVEARLKEHIEREFRKFLVWMIGTAIAAAGLTVTAAKYWVFLTPGR